MSLIIAVIAGVAIFVLKMISQYYKPVADKLPASVVDSGVLALILAAVLNIWIGQIPKISDSLGVLKGMQESSPEYIAMTAAARARNELSNIENPVVKKILRDYLESEARSFSNAIDSIHEQQITIDRSSAMDFGASAFAAANRSVETTSFVSPAEWWLNADGRAYFLKNEDAVKRGVKVSRIFIYRDSEELAELAGIISQQKKNGIEVYTISINDIPRGLNKDIIIVDDAVVGELSIDQETRDFNQVKVNTDQDTLSRVKEDWRDLKRLAQAG